MKLAPRKALPTRPVGSELQNLSSPFPVQFAMSLIYKKFVEQLQKHGVSFPVHINDVD